MSSRPRKHQRTTSITADETPPSTPLTAGLKARVSRGDDAADLKSLLHTISTCRVKANGFNFFHPPAFCDPPEHNDENVAYVTFRCKMWACAYSTKRLITSAPLAHLYSHGFRCAQDKGKVVVRLSDTPAWEGMGKLEGREVLQQFALWCTCNGCPFGITDDNKLPRLLDEVAGRHRPSASAISVAVNDLSDFCAAEIHSLVNTHSGEVLARVGHELCNEYGILNKVMGIAFDNTSNMGCMMDELGEYGLGKDKWVRCWAHILNLVVTTIFAYFNSTTESRFADPRPESEGEDLSIEDQHLSLNTRVVWFSNDDTADHTPSQKKCKSTEWPGGQMKPAEPKGKDRVEDIYREVHVWVESRGHREDKEEVDRWPTREETSSNHYTRSSTKWTINKAQKLAERCRHNRVICLALFNLSNLSTLRLPHLHSIYPAVKTTWNSQTRQFCQIVSHWAQIEKIQTDPKYNIKKENRLNRGDFRLLSDLLKVLELFDYYGKTGNCPYYATAILLHPVGSTCYLKCQNWPQVWIDDAIEATQALYNTRHLDKARTARTKAQDRRASSSTTTKSILELLDEDDIDLDLDNIVHNFATTKCAGVNVAGQPISALHYWKRQYVAGEMNEGLTELALDIFRCP
ncbi:hypothetical protein JCM21900_000685, partial [Sporobolomyces salmonicolor]